MMPRFDLADRLTLYGVGFGGFGAGYLILTDLWLQAVVLLTVAASCIGAAMAIEEEE